MKWIIFVFLVGVYLFETYVSSLNRKHSLKPIPASVKDVYDEERYNKWLAYSLEVQRFGLIEQGFQLLVMIVFLFGVFSKLEQMIGQWTAQPILQSLLFLGIVSTIMSLLNLPWQVYRIFSIEERHGFNRTTAKVFVRDLLVGFLLSMTLGGLVVASINALFLKFTTNLWLFIALTWATIAILMLMAVMFLGKLLLRLFNKFESLQEGTLRTKIEDLASSLGFNIKAISVMDASKRSTKSNAMFMGLGKTKEVILFDTLLEEMSDDEIVAVLGHELGHAMHKDTVRLLIQQLMVAALYALGIGLILQSRTLFSSLGFAGVHFGFALILFFILFAPISFLIGIPLNKLSRKAEFKADQFAAKHTNPKWMISALKVLSRENLVNLNPHPLAVLLYYSHPPMHERIDAIISK